MKNNCGHLARFFTQQNEVDQPQSLSVQNLLSERSKVTLKGPTQYILSCEKTTSQQIPNETVWPGKLLATNMTKTLKTSIRNIRNCFWKLVFSVKMDKLYLICLPNES